MSDLKIWLDNIFFPMENIFPLGLRTACLQTGGAHGCPEVPAMPDHFRAEHMQTLPPEQGQNPDSKETYLLWPSERWQNQAQKSPRFI